MTAVTQALSLALLHFVWQGLAVAFLLGVALYGLGRRSANARYAACGAALLVLAIAPVVTTIAVYRSPAQSDTSLAASVGLRATAPMTTTAAVPGGDWMAAVQTWALPVWSLGVLLFSIRLIYGCRQIAVLQRRCAPAEERVRAAVASLAARLGLTRAVRVLVASNAESPSVVGWLRPAILLPAATLLVLTPEQLEAVLAHELAHIRRHDYFVNLLQIVVETLLFYHPAVWWASSRMRQERELCCDDLAVRCCGDARCYARALTILERRRLATPAMAMGSNGGSMLYRIQRLLGTGAEEYAPSKLPGIAAIVLGLVCLALTLHHARGQEQNIGVAVKGDAVAVNFRPRSDGRDGPGVAVDLQGSAVQHRAPVEYPGAAWERHIEGTVLAEATLDSAGEVTDARILAGPSELRKAVLQSLLKWHFAPGGFGATKRVSISFRHTDDGGDARGWSVVADTARVTERQAQREEVEKLIAEFKAAHPGMPPLHEHGGANAEATAAEKELMEQYESLLRRRDEMMEPRPGDEIDGKKLRRLQMIDLSEEQRKALGARLPVRLGDVMTQESIDKLTKAVHDFDEHLETNIGVEDGGVDVRISVQGGRWYFFRNAK